MSCGVQADNIFLAADGTLKIGDFGEVSEGGKQVYRLCGAAAKTSRAVVLFCRLALTMVTRFGTFSAPAET